MLTAMIMIGTFSCKKDSDSPSQTSSPGFSAKYDGNSWTANAYTAGYLSYSHTLQIIGTKSNGTEQITLSLKTSTTGTFPISDTVSGSGIIGGLTFSSFGEDNHVGSIVITKMDLTANKISGTFSFDAYESSNVHHITEGKFTDVPMIVSK